jgi:hypothetical protein
MPAACCLRPATCDLRPATCDDGCLLYQEHMAPVDAMIHTDVYMYMYIHTSCICTHDVETPALIATTAEIFFGGGSQKPPLPCCLRVILSDHVHHVHLPSYELCICISYVPGMYVCTVCTYMVCPTYPSPPVLTAGTRRSHAALNRAGEGEDCLGSVPLYPTHTEELSHRHHHRGWNNVLLPSHQVTGPPGSPSRSANRQFLRPQQTPSTFDGHRHCLFGQMLGRYSTPAAARSP